MTHRLRPWLLLAVLSTGCEGDTLLSGDRLDALFGANPVPVEPAWAMAWLDDNWVLVTDCRLEPAQVVTDEEIVFGELVLDPPESGPTRWVDVEGHPLAVGFPLLVDATRFDPPDEPDGPNPLSFDRGVWGIPFSVRVVADFDDPYALTDVGEWLLADRADGLEPGASWWDILIESAALREDLEGTLVRSSVGAEDDGEGMFVITTDFASESHARIWSGGIFDGMVGGCE